MRVGSSGTAPDDVLIGEVTVIDRARAEVMTAATVDVSVREQPGGHQVPSRITVADEHGALVSLGNVTDATHAVRRAWSTPARAPRACGCPRADT